VTRQDIAATTPMTATLGYAGSWTVTGHGGGTLTWLPHAGQLIRQGHALCRTGNGSPVVLLHGSMPDWRTLAEGVTGADVRQLNHDLVHLGYANSPDIAALGWDYYSWETRYAVQQLEEHLGVSSPPGSLSLGQVVFEPEALRVKQVTGHLGGPASGTVLTACRMPTPARCWTRCCPGRSTGGSGTRSSPKPGVTRWRCWSCRGD
jgi:hypothetical protein